MAYGDPSTERDQDDYFDDGPKKEMAEHEGMDEEGILPKALMAGKEWKVGDEIVLEITRIGDKDFSVKYATDKGEEEHKEEMPEKETADMGGGGGSESESMMY